MQARITRGDGLRGAGEAARAPGGGGLAALGERTREWAGEGALTAVVRAEWAALLGAREEYGGAPEDPVTPDELAGYLTSLLLRGIGSQTLSGRLSRLLTYIRIAKPPHEGLGPEQLRELTRIAPSLAASFPSIIKQLDAFDDKDLLRVVSCLGTWADKGYLFALQWRAILLFARAGMLRSADWRAPAMAASQVTVVTVGEGTTAFKTCRVSLPFHKTERAAFNPRRHVVVLPRDSRYGGQLDYYPALLAYANAASIVLGETPTPLFPRYKRTSNAPRGRTVAYPYGAALADMRFVFRKAGLQAERYGLHSPRSSGATLLLSRGVPAADVARLGLWADAVTLLKSYDRREGALAVAASARLTG